MGAWDIFDKNEKCHMVVLAWNKLYIMKQALSLSKVAKTNIWVVIHYISRPVRLVLCDSKIQPWLVIPIVVDDRCVLYSCLVQGWIIAEPQHMPAPIKWIRQVIKRYQPRRQCPQFPQSSILILQNNPSSLVKRKANKKGKYHLGYGRGCHYVLDFIKLFIS